MHVPFRWMIVAQLLALVFFTGAASAQEKSFGFVAESAVYDPVTREVLFTIKFNQSPDFATLDSAGRQAHSFQYFIVGDAEQEYPAMFDAIIRGEEIHSTKNILRIRDATPAVQEPAAGGWGGIRGTVPFRLDGKLLTFSAPLQLISDHSANGNFAYRLETYEYGGLTKYVGSRSIVTRPNVQIDIKPGSADNSINPRSKGLLSVAILSTSAFDSQKVDARSVRFGPGAARSAKGSGHTEDVDRDGDLDLVLHFKTQDSAIVCGASSAALSGKTVGGLAFHASDSIRTVGCN